MSQGKPSELCIDFLIEHSYKLLERQKIKYSYI